MKDTLGGHARDKEADTLKQGMTVWDAVDGRVRTVTGVRYGAECGILFEDGTAITVPYDPLHDFKPLKA